MTQHIQSIDFLVFRTIFKKICRALFLKILAKPSENSILGAHLLFSRILEFVKTVVRMPINASNADLSTTTTRLVGL